MDTNTAASGSGPADRTTKTRGMSAAAILLGGGSIALTALVLGHRLIPQRWGLGLIADTLVPWLAILIPIQSVLACFVRRPRPIAALIAPAVAWLIVFVPTMIPLNPPASAPNTRTWIIASQNVEAASGSARLSAIELATAGADVIALQELDATAREEVDEVLDANYGYSYVVGTVGVWSKFPLLDARPHSLGLDWSRTLQVNLELPTGIVGLHVVHASSARPGDHSMRDAMLANLTATVTTDPTDRTLVVGDFNAASTDRHFLPLLEPLTEPRQSQVTMGFTWPSSPFPVARLDHILERGMVVVTNETVRAGTSDHLAVIASMEM